MMLPRVEGSTLCLLRMAPKRMHRMLSRHKNLDPEAKLQGHLVYGTRSASIRRPMLCKEKCGGQMGVAHVDRSGVEGEIAGGEA